MPDPTNLVSAELSDQDQAEALSLLDRVKRLFPFFATIPDKERRYLLYPGLRGMDAAQEMARVIRQYAEHFPKVVTDLLPEMEQDLRLAKVLRPVVKALQVLTRMAEDTLHAARSDAFRTALIAYAHAKPLAKAIPGLKKDIESLNDFFAKSRRTSQAAVTDPNA